MHETILSKAENDAIAKQSWSIFSSGKGTAMKRTSRLDWLATMGLPLTFLVGPRHPGMHSYKHPVWTGDTCSALIEHVRRWRLNLD